MTQSLYKDSEHELNLFASRVWGNSDAVLKHSGNGTIEFIDLGDYYLSMEHLFTGIVV